MTSCLSYYYYNALVIILISLVCTYNLLCKYVCVNSLHIAYVSFKSASPAPLLSLCAWHFCLSNKRVRPIYLNNLLPIFFVFLEIANSRVIDA